VNGTSPALSPDIRKWPRLEGNSVASTALFVLGGAVFLAAEPAVTAVVFVVFVPRVIVRLRDQPKIRHLATRNGVVVIGILLVIVIVIVIVISVATFDQHPMQLGVGLGRVPSEHLLRVEVDQGDRPVGGRLLVIGFDNQMHHQLLTVREWGRGTQAVTAVNRAPTIRG
jgi:hypothetical protein